MKTALYSVFLIAICMSEAPRPGRVGGGGEGEEDSAILMTGEGYSKEILKRTPS